MSRSINIYDMYQMMKSHELMLIYQGLFDQDMIKSVLSVTEKKLIQDNANENMRKKLFNIMVEGLQNICKHQLKTDDPSQFPFLVIGKDTDGYNVVTGNMIAADKTHLVATKLNHINSLTREELKEHYKQARLNSVISEVGGAGLGFIDMARKSGNKLEYKFYPVNDQYSFFILYSKVNNN